MTPMTPGTPGFDTESTPFMRPADVNMRHISGVFEPGPQTARGVLPKTVTEKPLLPEASKETPPEMLPVLSQLAAHNVRPYHEGYFMLLTDLNSDGKAPANREWTEVFGMLRGAQLATYNADELERRGADAQPQYINIDDASFKSVSRLPSPGGELSNIIVLSTTMKNRYLLQFSTQEQYHAWSSALRLSMFERTSLQEAYTGALLSCKGTKLNGIRSLLGPTKVKRDGWCSVRFGAGMPWRRVWVVCTPGPLLTAKEQKQGAVSGERNMSKKERLQLGRVAFYESTKNLKKPLAVIVRAYSAYAIFPEKAMLMDVSSLMKVEGHVIFAGEEKEPKLSVIHIMPDPRPCIQGFEVLIRFLIPVFDVFNLYGRPQRLNADKSDMRSLLFAMPTLPHVYYCDKTDVQMLLSQADWEQWDSKVWLEKIRELLARKISTGFKGLGSIHDFASDRASLGGTSIESSAANLRSTRAVSQPTRVNVPGLQTSSTDSLPRSIDSQSTPSNTSFATRSQEPLIKEVSRVTQSSSNSSFGQRPAATGPAGGAITASAMAGGAIAASGAAAGQQQRPPQVYPRVAPSNRQAPAAPRPQPGELSMPKRPQGSRPMPSHHERSQSEGQDPNTLIIAPGDGPLTPMLGSGWDPATAQVDKRVSNLSVADSFKSATDSLDRPATAGDSSSSVNVFDPGYRPPTSGGSAVANDSKSSRPKHMSYAQYSEYMETYIPPEEKAAAANAAVQPAASGRPTLLEIKKPDPSDLPANMPTTPVNFMSPPLGFDSPAAITQPRAAESPTSATPPSGFQNPYGTRSYNSPNDSLAAPQRTQQQRRPSGPRDPAAAQLQQSPQRGYPHPNQAFGPPLSQAQPNSGQFSPYAQQGPYSPAGNASSPNTYPGGQPNPYAQGNPGPGGPKFQGPYPTRPNQSPQHSQESLGRRAPPPHGHAGGVPQGMYAQPQPRPPPTRQYMPGSPAARRPVGKGQPPAGASAYRPRADGPYAAVGAPGQR